MFEALIKKIAAKLEANKIPYMIIGGQAVLLYGSPRLTRDIDITLGVDADSTEQVKNICNAIGLRILPDNIEKFVRKTMVLPAEDPKTRIRIDFIFSFSEYEHEAIKRAVKVKLGSGSAKFATVEDLIIHKIFAGRAVDIDDVRDILIKKDSAIDMAYVKKWLKIMQSLSYNVNMLSLLNKITADIRSRR